MKWQMPTEEAITQVIDMDLYDKPHELIWALSESAV